MSHYSERLVKSSKHDRRCAGCDNFKTIAKGQSYWSCWFTKGTDCGRYSLCLKCHAHLYGNESQEPCKRCGDVLLIESIRECRLRLMEEKRNEDFWNTSRHY